MTGLLGRCQNDFLVQRLDGEHINNLGRDLLLCQQICSCKRLSNLNTASSNGNVGALTQDVCKRQAALEGLIVDVVNLVTTHTHVEGAICLGSKPERCLGSVVICRNKHAHLRESAHHANVLEGLVSGAVLSYRNACVRRANLHVEARVADGVSNLIVSATGCKHGKRAGKHGASRKCQSRCNAYHVLLGNTHVNHALWEGLLEVGKFSGTGKVCVNGHNIVTLIYQLNKSLTICLTSCSRHWQPPYHHLEDQSKEALLLHQVLLAQDQPVQPKERFHARKPYPP